MKEKIAQLMKNESLSSSQLAEILEIQPSAVSHLLSGRNKPRFDLLQKILRRFPRINPDWLFLDSSQIYRDESSPAPDSSIVGDDESAIDLFGGDGDFLGVTRDGDSLYFDAENGGRFSQINGSNQTSNFEGNLGQKNGRDRGVISHRNSPKNMSQNMSQNRVQNGAQIGAQNRVQNGVVSPSSQGVKMGGVGVSVERIIVLYSDGTCRTYEMR